MLTNLDSNISGANLNKGKEKKKKKKEKKESKKFDMSDLLYLVLLHWMTFRPLPPMFSVHSFTFSISISHSVAWTYPV